MENISAIVKLSPLSFSFLACLHIFNLRQSWGHHLFPNLKIFPGPGAIKNIKYQSSKNSIMTFYLQNFSLKYFTNYVLIPLFNPQHILAIDVPRPNNTDQQF